MTVSTLQELKAMAPGAVRAAAIREYLDSGEAKLRAARLLRDEDLRVLVAKHGPSEAARRAGVSLSTVKLAVGRRQV